MLRRLLPRSLAGLFLALGFVLNPAPAYAQPLTLVAASPVPDSVVSMPINEVRLTFSHPLTVSGTDVGLYNESGKRVDNNDVHVDPSNLFSVAVTVPEIFEGRYTVRYTVNAIGESITSVGSYSFLLDLPAPVVRLSSPLSGQSFPPGPVPITVDTRFVSFEFNNSAIHIYVDGEFVDSVRATDYTLYNLSPGVHEIRVVLVQGAGQEVPETSNLVYIAITRPEAEIEEQSIAGEVGLDLNFGQTMALTIATGLLIGLGIWLGGPYLIKDRLESENSRRDI